MFYNIKVLTLKKFVIVAARLFVIPQKRIPNSEGKT